ncbi:chalcone isomerase family protein [Chitinilyticum aquatile]|uniref:chalcone isomerase family protein n=1 Tax=Chitinilyticum aquatile TaxID=362520 RepID=UPI000558353B|nr:chalcone isomerase family protein [Chitinilyticum aquatile]
MTRFVLILFGCMAIHAGVLAEAPRWLQDKLPQAQLVGKGEMRWLALRIYDARLYAPQGRLSPNQPYALQLIYRREIERDDIVSTSVDEIRRLFGPVPALAQWEDAMRRVFVDVKDGDELTGVYQPGGPARFYQQGRLLGEISDPEFGRAFFAIWLDPRTREPGLRRALLGQPA